MDLAGTGFADENRAAPTSNHDARESNGSMTQSTPIYTNHLDLYGSEVGGVYDSDVCGASRTGTDYFEKRTPRTPKEKYMAYDDSLQNSILQLQHCEVRFNEELSEDELLKMVINMVHCIKTIFGNIHGCLDTINVQMESQRTTPMTLSAASWDGTYPSHCFDQPYTHDIIQAANHCLVGGSVLPQESASANVRSVNAAGRAEPVLAGLHSEVSQSAMPPPIPATIEDKFSIENSIKMSVEAEGVIHQMRNKLKTLQHTVLEAQKKSESLDIEISRLNDVHRHEERHSQEREKQNQKLAQENSRLTDGIKLLKEKIFTLEQANGSLELDKNHLENNVSKLKEDNKTIQCQIITLEKANTSLEMDKNNFKGHVSKLEDEYKKIKSQIITLEERNRALELDKNHFKGHVSKLEDENKKIKPQIITLEEKNRALELDKNHFKGHVSKLEDENKKIKSQIITLEEKNRALELDKNHLEDNVSKLEEENYKTKSRHKRLKNELMDMLEGDRSIGGTE